MTDLDVEVGFAEVRPSRGQRLASEQLAALAQGSGGSIQVLEDRYVAQDRRLYLIVSLRLDLPPGGPGIRLRSRERFVLAVNETFPFAPPTVTVPHRRWAGTPHVQWGRQLCLYAAPSNEWMPADGVRGLLERLILWLERAAAGTLDADGMPVHPPVAYAAGSAGTAVVRADLGDRVPWRRGQDVPELLIALCSSVGDRLNVVDWVSAESYQAWVLGGNDPGDGGGSTGGRSGDNALCRDGVPMLACPAIILPADIGFEYPLDAAGLLSGLAGHDLSAADVLALLAVAAHGNVLSASARGVTPPADGESWPHGPGGAPQVLLVGTPSREVEPGQRVAHLVGWRISQEGGRITELHGTLMSRNWDQYVEHEELGERVRALRADVATLGTGWLADTKIRWLRVFEDRPETTRQRDQDSAAAWLLGRRVLVLGCGALGAPVAEMAVRAGAQLVVVDSGVVTPGILVRQPYSDSDIGAPKAQMLADRLRHARAGASVTGLVCDGLDALDDVVGGHPFDLVVDATADAGLRAAVERTRAADPYAWPPLLTMLVGHRARRGLIAVSRTGATGGGHDVLRRVAVAARSTHADTLADIAEDLYPDPPRTDVFLPEPGCSAPTFTGSQVEAAALAAALLSAGLDALAGRLGGDAAGPMAAAAVRLEATDARRAGQHGAGAAGTTWLGWPNDLLVPTVDGRLTVRVAGSALATIRAEVRRGARLRAPNVETGGMLLGALDEAVGVVHIDVATPPSPDSRCSAIHFAHGVNGSQDLVDHYLHVTGRVTAFVGMWHTHPHGPARPSPTDELGMANLVTPVLGGPPRSLMLIVGGPEESWSAWRDEAEGPVGRSPETYARLVRRCDRSTAPPSQPPAPPGQYWLAADPAPGSGKQPWWRRWRRAPGGVA